MEWEGDEGNELGPAWSCNPVSMRCKLHSASHIQSCKWVHTGIIRILYVCSIQFSQCCNFVLHGGHLASFSHFQRCFLTQASQAKCEPQANTLGTELVKKRKVDKETNAETLMPSKQRREMDGWWDYVSHEIDVSKEFDANFNFPKIHLISHWVEQIRRYGAFQQYSAKRHEQAHIMNLKDGWNASNHKLNYLPQLIAIQRRILFFEIRELNLKALAQCRENCATTCKVLPSSADLAALLSSKSYPKPQFMGLHNRCNGKHHDTMINDFRALLDYTQDATHHMTIYSSTREFIKHKSCKTMYMLDEQLHSMELCIYHGIQLQVESLDGECISLLCRCTESQRWREWDRQNDWVWVNQPPGRCYGMPNGPLLWQLEWRFEITVLNKNRSFI